MKRIRSYFLIICAVLLLVVSGCGSGTTKTITQTVTNTVTKTVTETSTNNQQDANKTIKIVDHAGLEVEIPSNITRVVIDQVPLTATYCMYMGGNIDKLIGVSGSVLNYARMTVLIDIIPELNNVNTSFYENGELNIEELIKLKPDVVLYNAGNAGHRELFQKAGIPCVGFSTDGDPTLLYAEWLRLLEKVFQEEGKVADKIAYGDSIIADTKARVANVSDSEKVNALILFSWRDGSPSVAGANKHFGRFWLAAANVNNAAQSQTGIASVNMEQLYSWNPDIIFMPGPMQCPISPAQVLSNSVEGADFSPLKAVQNGQVYSSDYGMNTWYTPNPDAPLVITWIAMKCYPELFKDVDLAKLTKDWYKKSYGFELTDAQVAKAMDRDYKG